MFPIHHLMCLKISTYKKADSHWVSGRVDDVIVYLTRVREDSTEPLGFWTGGWCDGLSYKSARGFDRAIGFLDGWMV
jgi:hypothetical protein